MTIYFVVQYKGTQMKICNHCDEKATCTVVIDSISTPLCEEHYNNHRSTNKVHGRRWIDICHYCGFEYHPMPRYVKDRHWICVCAMIIKEDGSIIRNNGCISKAIKEGYVRRQDKTPTR